tara:strand:+ start:210 stop:395 length:186 start_codon:yes stop_codon:yes gene_type:complete
MNERTTQWYIEAINETSDLEHVLRVWREAEEHLEVRELVKIHEACSDKVIKSIKNREVKNG